jgi:hypothetical protein
MPRSLSSHSASPAAQRALSILGGWEPQPPRHRALEAVSRELEDVQERDAAAREAFLRRGMGS